MSAASPSVRVHVNIDVSAASLQAVVAQSKQQAGRDAGVGHAADTADLLSAMVSKFLRERDFEAFASDPANYG